MKIHTGFAEVNGTRLYYEMAGEGQALIFMHGFTSDHRSFKDQFDFFSRYYRVVCYDLRGFGKSNLPTDTKSHYDKDLKGLMDHLGIKSAYIGGRSLGGLVTIKFALAFPDAIDALIPIDSGLEGFNWSKEISDSFGMAYKIGREKGIPAAKKYMGEHPLGAPLREKAKERPELAARLKAISDDYSGWHYVHSSFTGHHDKTVAGRIKTITKPTLVVIGELDLPDFHHVADLLVEKIPNARKFFMKGVGHGSNVEDPETFNKGVLKFLQSCDASRNASN